MYESFFGLSRRPFSESIPIESMVVTPSRDAALRRLRYGLEHGEGIAVLHGPTGSGKTLLARELAHEMNLPTVCISFPALPSAELLAYLADELHAPGRDTSLAGALRRIRTALGLTAAQGMRTLLVVDEAQLIADDEAFESLRLLTNFATAGPADLMLLLVGATELLLRVPPSLLDRLSARALIGPLEVEETRAYLTGRLTAAGASGNLFDDEAIELLHLAADGLPRRLNRLADLALLIAYAEGVTRPDLRIVRMATRDDTHEALAA